MRPLRHRFRLLPCALAALLTAQPDPGRALEVFTGNRPVYIATWFNGSSTELHEFAYALDWAGYCNAHAGAQCTQYRFWNVAGNWDTLTVPDAQSGDARVPAGMTVRVSGMNSQVLGYIPDSVRVASLTAAGRVEVGSFLGVVDASIADLYLFSFARVETSGSTTVGLLSSGLGEFSGSGTTRLMGWQANNLGRLDLRVDAGHTLELAGGGAPLPLQVRLEPGSRLVNSGALQSAGADIGLQGTANLLTLPVFDNTGALIGPVQLSAVRFNNAGQVQLGVGEYGAYGALGRHDGSFAAAAGSTLVLGGLGGTGHEFQAGSTLVSQGQVVVGRGQHRVQGAWSTASTQVQSGGRLSFVGSAPHISSLRVTNPFSQLDSDVAAGFANVIVDDGGMLWLPAAGNRIDRLELDFGTVRSGGLEIAQALDWGSGRLDGSVRLTGAGTLRAGQRALSGALTVHHRLDWQAGSFSDWAGVVTLLPGATLDLQGDVGAGGSGALQNQGRLVKSAGAGRAQLGVAVHSTGGLTQVDQGVLAFSGGGTHRDALFSIAPGARLELSGPTVLAHKLSVTGRLDFVDGGSLRLADGIQYTHGAGHRFEVGALTIEQGARLDLPDAVTVGGTLNNAGTLRPAASLQVGADFLQWGSFALPAGAGLTVGGQFVNGQPLVLTDSPLRVGRLDNPSQLTLTGSVDAELSGPLHNDGLLRLQATAGTGRLSLVDAYNKGRFIVDGAAHEVLQGGSFANAGDWVNEGVWRAQGSFIQQAGGHADNRGLLDITGQLGVMGGATLSNGGVLQVNGGTVVIDAGGLLDGSGSFQQLSGLTVVNGVLRVPGGLQLDGGLLKGTGSVDGSVLIGPGATWAPGNSPGTFSVLGDVWLDGRLEVEVVDAQVHDRLVVGGRFTAGPGAVVALQFSPGYLPSDGESIDWLQASAGAWIGGSLEVDGLGAGWAAVVDPASGLVELQDPAAERIPTAGQYTVAAGRVGFNPQDPAGPLLVTTLQVDGRFSNRRGAEANIGTLDNRGVVVNRGLLWANELRNPGELQLLPGSQLSANLVVNSGRWLQQGTAEVYQLHNTASGEMQVDGPLRVTSQLLNEGALRVAARLDSAGLVLNRGRLEIAPGGVLAIQTPWASQPDLQQIGAGAELVVDGRLEAAWVDLWDGRLSGNGTVQGRVTAGYSTIAPGHSPGTLTIDGTLDASTATLELDLAGPNDVDRLVVTGDAQLGRVVFVLSPDYRPQAGDRFDVLAVGGRLQVGSWVVLAHDAWGGTYLWGDSTGVYDPWTPQAASWRVGFEHGQLSVSAVPEAPAWALWAGGLGIGAWLRRRAVAQRP